MSSNRRLSKSIITCFVIDKSYTISLEIEYKRLLTNILKWPRFNLYRQHLYTIQVCLQLCLSFKLTKMYAIRIFSLDRIYFGS